MSHDITSVDTILKHCGNASKQQVVYISVGDERGNVEVHVVVIK